MILTIFIENELKPVDGNISHVSQVVVDALYLVFDAGNEFVSLILIELQYALHLNLHESENIVASNFTHKTWLKRSQLLVNESHSLVHALSLLKAALLIHALLDKNLFERREEELLHKFSATYL